MQRARRSMLTLAAALLAPVGALAQFPSALVGFNGPPIDDPATSQEMFRIPQISGTTAAFITPNIIGFDNNWAFRASGRQTEGDAGLYVRWSWVTPSDLESWCRLTTFAATVHGNPALHVGGKVRFKLINESELFVGRIGICLGVRETGVNVPQLDNGGTAGDIEWVGVSTANSVILAGPDTVLDSTPAGDDFIQAIAAGGSAIVAGPNGVLDSTAANDDVVEQGFTYGANGERRPIPALELNPNALPYVLEWNLATGVVSVGGVPMGGGFAPFTGNGVLSSVNGRGTLEHIAIVNAETNGAFLGEVEFSIDELQFEAPVADPVVPPIMVSPIIAGATNVTVSGIRLGVDRVNLIRNGLPYTFQNVTTTDDVVFNLTGDEALEGETFSATQTDLDSGQTSDESNVVTVFAAPPPWGVSIVLDEDGDNAGACTFNGAGGGWEFVGATSLTTLTGGFLMPQGTAVFENNAVWQTIEWPLDDPDVVVPWLGGDGDVDLSPTGRYALDTIWFNILNGAVGPHEVFIDKVEIVDGADVVVAAIYDFDNGVTVLNAIRGQSNTAATTAALSTLASYSGRTSHRVTWTYGASTDRALGLLARQGASCATRATFDAPIALEGARFRLRLCARSEPINAVALPVVIDPSVNGDTAVRIGHAAGADSVTLYVNGVQVGAPIANPAGTVALFSPVPALLTGDSVSAKQVVGGVESDFAYPKAVVPTPLLPTAPVLIAPVEAGQNAVNVSGLSADTTLVEILDSTPAVIGSTTTINVNGTATIPLSRALIHLEVISARATNTAGSTPSAAPLEVGNGNGDILICVGIRETGDTGPLGSTGSGAALAIEWIGASSQTGGVPAGRPISPSANWQTLTFDPLIDPITAFPASGPTANGAIDGVRGVLEHIAITMNSTSPNRSTGLYEVYIDNVTNLNADGGPDFVITDFESFAPGVEALFQEPRFSGTTDLNLTLTPNISRVSSAFGNPGQSAELSFFFRSTGPTRWVRLTTSGATNLSRPIIDITKPIRFDILLQPAAPSCPGERGDANCDGNVDFFDIDPFLQSLFDPSGYAATHCGGSICAVDIDCSGGVDFFDIDPFLVCLFGACNPCP